MYLLKDNIILGHFVIGNVYIIFLYLYLLTAILNVNHMPYSVNNFSNLLLLTLVDID